MFRKFASIGFPETIGYCVDSEKWGENAFLHSELRQFSTFGDGLTQHSPDVPVTEEYAIDFLHSLALFMQSDEEVCERMAYRFNESVCQQKLEFAASLVYDEKKDSEWNKHRYYSMELLKVTRDQEKQHDKRFSELNKYQDGTAKSILALVCGRYQCGLAAYLIAERVRTWCNDNPKLKTGLELPPVHFGWFRGDREKAREFRDAVEACQHLSQIPRMRKNAVQQVENYKNRLERERERKAAEALEMIESSQEPAA